MGRVTSRYRVLRLIDGVGTERPDSVAAEEPLEIRVAGHPLAVTMRTPGDDFDLARGFLVSEGVVSTASDVAAIRYCAGATADGANTYNVLDVRPRRRRRGARPVDRTQLLHDVVVRGVRQGQPRRGAHRQPLDDRG